MIYTNNLPSEIQLPSDYQKWRFNVKVNPLLKQPIINRLFHEGLFASSHYHSANILFDDELFSNSNKLFTEIINLFNDYSTEEDLNEDFKGENFKYSNLKYIGQLFKCYLLCEYNEEFYIVDMHAGHERVNYDKNGK